MAARCIENEGRGSECCRVASRAVLARPWVVLLLLLSFALVMCSG